MGSLAIAVLAVGAFWVGRLLKARGLSELVGFLLVGVLVGPVGLGLVSAGQVERLGPVMDVALGLLMFSAGERINLREIRRVGWTLPVGTIQYLLCGVLVYVVAIQCGAGAAEAILLATLAGSGGPLTLAALISRRRDRSSYAEGLLAAHVVGRAHRDRVLDHVGGRALPARTGQRRDRDCDRTVRASASAASCSASRPASS